MKRWFILLLFALLWSVGVRSQQIVPDLSGTDFWVGFLPNVSVCSCSLLIASEDTCTAHIECQSLDFSTTVSILPHRITQVMLPNPTIDTLFYSCYDHGFHVTTTAPAVVTASNFHEACHDISAILPTSRLKCDYVVSLSSSVFTFFYNFHKVAILAPYNNTEVFVNGDTLAILQRGEMYMYTPTYFDSYSIHSSHPVAVFQGNVCTQIPAYFDAQDHLYEQSFPPEYWGQHFMVMPTSERSNYTTLYRGSFIGDMVQVTSRDDSCIVTIGGQQVANLNANESYTFLIANHSPDTSQELYPYVEALHLDFYQTNALYIETSKPASTCFYITSVTFGGTPGDPSSVIVPPLEQSVSHAIAATYNTRLLQNHFINLVAPTDDVPLITLNGQSIANEFTPTPEGYSWARLTIDTGTHVIDADAGRFLATFYGLGDAESYAYIAGAAVRSNSYDVRADRHYLCPDDTATIIVRHDSAVYHTTWQLDGQPLGTDMDTVHLTFDSAGIHRLRVVITPPNDTVWEIIHFNPNYFIHSIDTLCPGESIEWSGRQLMNSGLYTDSLLTTWGCDSIVSLQLTVLNAPKANFVLDTDCTHYCYNILAHSEGDTTGYHIFWQATPPDPALEGQPWDSLSLSPTQTVIYKFAIEGFCPFDTTFVLKPVQWPVARMKVLPETVMLSERNSFDAYDLSQQATGRRWDVDGVTQTENGSHLHYTLNGQMDSVLVVLTAYNDYCIDTANAVVKVLATDIYAPNVFTPEADLNNRFSIITLRPIEGELSIYNREGLLVFRTDDLAAGWNGLGCPQGAYVWHLRYRFDFEADHTSHTAVGTVTLLR